MADDKKKDSKKKEEPQVQISIINADTHEDDAEWMAAARLTLQLYVAAPVLYEALYTATHCHGHDWKPEIYKAAQDALNNKDAL